MFRRLEFPMDCRDNDRKITDDGEYDDGLFIERVIDQMESTLLYHEEER